MEHRDKRVFVNGIVCPLTRWVLYVKLQWELLSEAMAKPNAAEDRTSLPAARPRMLPGERDHGETLQMHHL